MPDSQNQIIQQAEVQPSNPKVNEVQIQPTVSPAVQNPENKTSPTSQNLLAQNKPMEGQSSMKQFPVQTSEKETSNQDTVRAASLSVPKATTGQTIYPEKQSTTQANNVKTTGTETIFC